MVYVREAHPTDGWQVPANERVGALVKTHTSFDDRTEAAETCSEELKISIPIIVDGMDDKVEKAYAGWPDRLYVVGVDGKIAFAGGPGPRGFQPSLAKAALAKLIAE